VVLCCAITPYVAKSIGPGQCLLTTIKYQASTTWDCHNNLAGLRSFTAIGLLRGCAAASTRAGALNGRSLILGAGANGAAGAVFLQTGLVIGPAAGSISPAHKSMKLVTFLRSVVDNHVSQAANSS